MIFNLNVVFVMMGLFDLLEWIFSKNHLTHVKHVRHLRLMQRKMHLGKVHTR